MKIGILREGKVPVDHRVPFTPEQCKEIKEKFNVEVVVKSSEVRCFPDKDFSDQGIKVVDDISDCDVLFGVKEVQEDELISDKMYFFFSHTIKKQPFNQTLLQKVIKKNIQLVDYECLRKNDRRVVAFGRFAGIVGAYNGIWTWGKKHGTFDIKRACACKDIEELWKELKKITLPGLKAVLTGGGRVSTGAEEVLHQAGFTKVSTKDYLNKSFENPVYVQLDTDQYNVPKDSTGVFNVEEFYTHPENYISSFPRFLGVTDMFIAGAYWDPAAPALFTREDTRKNFRMKVIADITCDIDGSIPTTIKATTIDDPVYDFDLEKWEERPPFSDNKYLSVMSVDNLPCEVPRDASESFGRQLIDNVVPELFKADSQMIDEASITTKKGLNKHYEYLRDYAEGKE